MIYNYKLTGSITPKARPRFSGKRAYLPAKYRDWKKEAITQLKAQKPPVDLITSAGVLLDFGGNQRGDLDNLAGAVLDALVQAGILKDDSIKVVNELCLTFSQERESGCLIRLATGGECLIDDE